MGCRECQRLLWEFENVLAHHGALCNRDPQTPEVERRLREAMATSSAAVKRIRVALLEHETTHNTQPTEGP